MKPQAIRTRIRPKRGEPLRRDDKVLAYAYRVRAAAILHGSIRVELIGFQRRIVRADTPRTGRVLGTFDKAATLDQIAHDLRPVLPVTRRLNDGSVLMTISASAAHSLKSVPLRLVLVDEIDEYPERRTWSAQEIDAYLDERLAAGVMA